MLRKLHCMPAQEMLSSLCCMVQARWCAKCQAMHPAQEGDVWLESEAGSFFSGTKVKVHHVPLTRTHEHGLPGCGTLAMMCNSTLCSTEC